MSIIEYLVAAVVALNLGIAVHLLRREQRVRVVLFLGVALVLVGRIHMAFSIVGIVMVLFALFKGPEIAKP